MSTHTRDECEEWAKCPQHRTPDPKPLSCCNDPCVRGGMCVNCGEWINDNEPHVGGTTPQGDNEG